MTSGCTDSRLLDQIILSLDKSGDLAVKTYFKALASTQVPVADTNESNSHSVHNLTSAMNNYLYMYIHKVHTNQCQQNCEENHDEVLLCS